MNARVGDIIERWETRGDLVARGLTEHDADEAIAFRMFLSRPVLTPPISAVDRAYAFGQLTAREYIRLVAPAELTR